MPTESEQAERILDALGHHTRREILKVLRNRPLPVGALAAHFPVSRPAISKHLRILQAAGLVQHRVQGASNIFYLQTDAFVLVHDYLEQFWAEALDRFAQAAAQECLLQEEDRSQDDKMKR